jgi:hypothetical protein
MFTWERSDATETLGKVARADPALADRQLLEHLLEALKKDKDAGVPISAAEALVVVARAAPDRATVLLLAALNDKDSWVVGSAAAEALGEVARADPALADRLLDHLLAALKDEIPNVRTKIADALGGVAQVNGTARARVFQLMINYDPSVRSTMRDPLVKVLVTQAEEEAKKGSDPVGVLLDHLQGKQSFLPEGNANTHAVYRDVVVGALAQQLVSDQQNAARLKEELERLRKGDALHLRIAVWKVLVEAAELRAQPKQPQVQY